MTAVTSAISTLVDVVGEVFTVISGNAYLVVILAGGLLAVGISIFRKLKGAAR